jgi:hypothetical protein
MSSDGRSSVSDISESSPMLNPREDHLFSRRNVDCLLSSPDYSPVACSIQGKAY